MRVPKHYSTRRDNWENLIQMRAEIQTMVDDIKQSVGLLRRHL